MEERGVLDPEMKLGGLHLQKPANLAKGDTPVCSNTPQKPETPLEILGGGGQGGGGPANEIQMESNGQHYTGPLAGQEGGGGGSSLDQHGKTSPTSQRTAPTKNLTEKERPLDNHGENNLPTPQRSALTILMRKEARVGGKELKPDKKDRKKSAKEEPRDQAGMRRMMDKWIHGKDAVVVKVVEGRKTEVVEEQETAVQRARKLFEGATILPDKHEEWRKERKSKRKREQEQEDTDKEQNREVRRKECLGSVCKKPENNLKFNFTFRNPGDQEQGEQAEGEGQDPDQVEEEVGDAEHLLAHQPTAPRQLDSGRGLSLRNNIV